MQTLRIFLADDHAVVRAGIANALRELEREPVLLMTGGTWDPHSESFQGQVAEQLASSYAQQRNNATRRVNTPT